MPTTTGAGLGRRLVALATLVMLLVSGCSTPVPRGNTPDRPGEFISPAPRAEAVPVSPPLEGAPLPRGEEAAQTPGNPAGGTAGRIPITGIGTHRFVAGGIRMTVLTFDHRRHQLDVLDNEGGPGTGATSAGDAAKKTGALAAINGGFFTPEGAPLGLVVENGTRFGSLNASSLGAGIFFRRSEAGLSGLVRRGHWKADGARPSESLLQSGPLLVERGKAVSGLSKARPRPRSFLLWDGRFGWAIGYAGSATLSGLASALATQPVPGLTIDTGLNLDGGSSCDLWISPTVKGGPARERPLWRKPVRNYLVLTKSSP